MGLFNSKNLYDTDEQTENIISNMFSINTKKGVFNKELEKLNSIVNEVITTKKTFKNSNYNFLNPKVCDKYTLVMQNSLNKHLKVELHDLATEIYLVPKTNNSVNVKSKDGTLNTLSKTELCSYITDHYKKTLQVLSLIREIYDFENGGDYSIAGIIYRNLDASKGVFQVNYCASPQEPINEYSKVDFKELKGLDLFVNSFLNETEANTFVKHLKQLFGQYNKRRIAQSICEDTIVSTDKYKEIYENIQIQCGGDLHNRRMHNLFFNVSENKPILAYDLCFDKQKITTTYSRKTRDLFNKFKQDYMTNLDEIHDIMNLLLIFDNQSQTYKLRELTNEMLKSVQQKVKKTIILLFVQSMVNYIKIFNHLQSLKTFDS